MWVAVGPDNGMDKRQLRTQAKRENILRVARALFTARGVQQVSVDEIAAQANVSKVTVYKYFGSKDELYAEVVNQFMEETLVATEAVFHSEVDFLDKLKFAVGIQTSLSQLVSYAYLFDVWEKRGDIASRMDETMQKVRALMLGILEEGKRLGFIDPHLSFDMLRLYSEIFREGMKAKSIDLESTLADKDAVETLMNLYFFGIIRRPG